MDLAGFAARMERKAAAVPRLFVPVLQGTAARVLEVLTANTPVDTGRARSNWLVSIATERDTVIEPHFPYPKETNPAKFAEEANQLAANQAGYDVLATMIDPETIYVQNSVDYIGTLNDGDSVQHPGNFVAEAVIEASVHAKALTLDLDSVK